MNKFTMHFIRFSNNAAPIASGTVFLIAFLGASLNVWPVSNMMMVGGALMAACALTCMFLYDDLQQRETRFLHVQVFFWGLYWLSPMFTLSSLIIGAS